MDRPPQSRMESSWFSRPRKSGVELVDFEREAFVNPGPSSELGNAAFSTLTKLEPPWGANPLHWKWHWPLVARPWIILARLKTENGAISGQLGSLGELKWEADLICLPNTDKVFSCPSHGYDSTDECRLVLHAVEALVG